MTQGDRPGDIYLGYAGSRPVGDRTHQALVSPKPGDPVPLVAPNDLQGRVSVKTAEDVPVARLSAAASVQWSRLAPSIDRVRILAMVKRFRRDNAEEWRDRVQVDAWDVPVIEVWTNAAR